MVPSTWGYFGLRLATGFVVMGCGLPDASRAWNSTLTAQLLGMAFETSTRQRLPCKSPAYTRFAPPAVWPPLFTAMTLDRPFEALKLHAAGTAAHKSTLALPTPVCGFSAYRNGF